MNNAYIIYNMCFGMPTWTSQSLGIKSSIEEYLQLFTIAKLIVSCML